MSAVVAAAKRANNLYFAIDGNGSDHQQPRVIGREGDADEAEVATALLIYLKCNFSSFQASYICAGWLCWPLFLLTLTAMTFCQLGAGY